MTIKNNYTFIYVAWLISVISIIGSLFFSFIMELPPCSLCWYQRISLFPLGIILAVGFFKNDKLVFLYSFPLALIGWGISIYHNLLYYDLIPEPITPCSGGVSCTEAQFELLGFISIPLMALLSLTGILILLFLFAIKQKEVTYEQKT